MQQFRSPTSTGRQSVRYGAAPAEVSPRFSKPVFGVFNLDPVMDEHSDVSATMRALHVVVHVEDAPELRHRLIIQPAMRWGDVLDKVVGLLAFRSQLSCEHAHTPLHTPH